MTNGDKFKQMFKVEKEESCYNDSIVAISVDGFEVCFPAKWWKAELKEIKDIRLVSISDKPGIKLADQIVKEMDVRGQVIVPDNCVTGEAFEEWLYRDREEPRRSRKRNCEKCKHRIPTVDIVKGKHIYGCESWECKFEPKEAKE